MGDAPFLVKIQDTHSGSSIVFRVAEMLNDSPLITLLSNSFACWGGENTEFLVGLNQFQGCCAGQLTIAYLIPALSGRPHVEAKGG
jgi:hypothetical protein